MGFVWSLVVPPLQAHDEPAHVYFSQRLAETGHTPRPEPVAAFSEEELTVINGVQLFDVVGNTDGRPPWTDAQDKQLRRQLDAGLHRVSQGGDGGVGSYTPGYYALGAVAYRLSPSTSLLDRLWAMRLVSVILAGVSALFVFLFLREALPRYPWTWASATLISVLQPKLGFMSGVFNPDLGMIAISSALFFLLARAFRTRLTTRLGVLIGFVFAIGVLVKISMVGLAPGVALAVLLLLWRDRAWRAAGLALSAFAVPMVLYAAVNVLIWDRPALLGSAATGVATRGVSSGAGSFREMLSYIWQDYLPRLPLMIDQSPGEFPLWDRWFVDWAGRFGWGDYAYPAQAATVVAAILLLLLLLLLLKVLRESCTDIASRWREILSYGTMSLGLLGLLAYTGYGYLKSTGFAFEQGRYLLPLTALFAAFVAGGLAALKPRAGVLVGSVLVAAAFCWNVWGLLLTVARFYA
jgi:4-amino-4-deoxy-L-arabinose transferase-like glycosyltransferase